MVMDSALRAEPAPVAAQLSFRPLGGTFGAQVLDCDLSQHLDENIGNQLRDALRQHKVLVFDPQPGVGPRELLALGKLFGNPETEHPTWQNVPGFPGVQRLTAHIREHLEDSWHTDGSTRQTPNSISILQGIEVPEYGRDTIFADMEAAFDSLTLPLRTMLEGLTALHSWGGQRPDAPPVEHPVVITDPVNGRKTLYVNKMYTRSIVGMRQDESDHLLEFLYAQAHFGELQIRVSWKPGSIAIWDNMKTQHYLVRDLKCSRVMHRVVAL